MEGRADTLTLEVSAIGGSFSALERAIEERRAIVLLARKGSSDGDALSASLRPLLTQHDDRSDWRAMRDAWRLRHFVSCFGMAERAGYAWRLCEAGSHISVTFDPPRQPAG
jgi:hypothetical protein